MIIYLLDVLFDLLLEEVKKRRILLDLLLPLRPFELLSDVKDALQELLGEVFCQIF